MKLIAVVLGLILGISIAVMPVALADPPLEIPRNIPGLLHDLPGVDLGDISLPELRRYLRHVDDLCRRIDHYAAEIKARIDRILEKIGDDPQKKAEFVARATRLINQAETRLNEGAAKLKAKIEAIEGHDEQKAKALAAVDKIVAKVSGVIADVKDRISEVGQGDEVIAAERTLPIGPPDIMPVDGEEPQPIGLPDRQPRDREPRDREPRDRELRARDGVTLPPKYLEDAAARLDEMAARVKAKAEETRQRIESSNLSSAEKTRLLEKISRAEQYALARIDGLRDKLGAPADVVAENDQHRDQQDGEQHRTDEQHVGDAPVVQSKGQQDAVMKQVEGKRTAEENGALVPGTGGKPLEGRFEREGGAPTAK